MKRTATFVGAAVILSLAFSRTAANGAVAFSLEGDGGGTAVHNSNADGVTAPGVTYTGAQVYAMDDNDLDAYSADMIANTPAPLNVPGFGNTYLLLYSLNQPAINSDVELSAAWRRTANKLLLLDTGITEGTLGIGLGSDLDAFDHRDPPNDPALRYSVRDPFGNDQAGVPVTAANIYDRGPGPMGVGPYNLVFDETLDVGVAAGDNIDAWTFVLGHVNPVTGVAFNTGALFSVKPNAAGVDNSGAPLRSDTIYWTDLARVPGVPGPTVLAYLTPGQLNLDVGVDVDALDVLGVGPLPPWIPEPATLWLVTFGGLAMLNRRR